jgi:hypothetical protein
MSPYSSTVHAPSSTGLGETRSRFLLARTQAAAQASTAQYVRARKMVRWAAPDANADFISAGVVRHGDRPVMVVPSTQIAQPRGMAVGNGGLRVQVFPLDD